MDAFLRIQNLDKSSEINEIYFHELVAEFQETYLLEKNYHERLRLHRNPQEVNHAILYELNAYLLHIQQREEMRDVDLQTNAAGFVNTRINDIWQADKRINYYEAIKEYCHQRAKDFNIIAVHIAEYKALSELFKYLQYTEVLQTIARQPVIGSVPIGKTVHPLQFTILDGAAFERLIYAYVCKLFPSKFVSYLGQAGNDGGRDIWVDYNGESHCYQCANYRLMTFRKGKEDIDKLIYNKTVPDKLSVVCGGSVSAGLRQKIIEVTSRNGIGNVVIWSGVELEEELRSVSPDLLKRFFNGDPFPETGPQVISDSSVIADSVTNNLPRINAFF